MCNTCGCGRPWDKHKKGQDSTSKSLDSNRAIFDNLIKSASRLEKYMPAVNPSDEPTAPKRRGGRQLNIEEARNRHGTHVRSGKMKPHHHEDKRGNISSHSHRPGWHAQGDLPL